MKQTELIERHLSRYKTISPLEAQSNYNIWRLAAVVKKLRNRGHSITTKMKVAPSGAKYAEYAFAG